MCEGMSGQLSAHDIMRQWREKAAAAGIREIAEHEWIALMQRRHGWNDEHEGCARERDVPWHAS